MILGLRFIFRYDSMQQEKDVFMNNPSAKAECIPPGAPSVLSWRECLAKSDPEKSVLRHSLECGAVYEALLKTESLPEDLIGPDTALFALGHDCGKISPRFQADIGRLQYTAARLRSKEKRHEVISEAAMEDFLGPRRDAAAKIAGWHHGKHRDPGDPADALKFGGPDWQEQRRAFLEEVARCAEHVPARMNDASTLLAAGMICIADWISSDERNFPEDLTDSYEEMKAEAGRILQRIGWRRPGMKRGLAFRDIFPFEPNEAQKRLCEEAVGPGVYVLENTMGAGKTEAALYAAYRLISGGVNRGLFFALPTRLTSNKIHERVRKFLDRVLLDPGHARLIHGSAWLESSGGGEMGPGEDWFAPSKRALLEPFGVGTIDQALKGVLNVRHFFVRLAGLAGKVVIVDEAHSYDAYMFFLLKELCRILVELKCTVIVLSATLPAARRAELLGCAGAPPQTGYPRLTRSRDGRIGQDTFAPSRRMTVGIRAINPESAAAEAIEAARNCCNTAIIVNTISGAQDLFRHIRAEITDGEFLVGLLHSRFPFWRRNGIEQKWLDRLGKDAGAKRPHGSILISTQIIEQSVDLDFDFMISETVPSDLMFQRMGRLWRHERANRPVSVPVFCWMDHRLRSAGSAKNVKSLAGSNGKVYAPWLLLRSERIWSDMREAVIPDDMDAVLERNYGEVPADEIEAELLREYEAEVSGKETKANTASQLSLSGTQSSQDDDGDDAPTRLSDYPQVSVLLARAVREAGNECGLTLSDGTDLELGKDRFELAKMKLLAANLASVPAWWLDRDLRLTAELPEALKTYWKFDAPVLLRIAEDGALFLQDETETMIRYDNDYGLSRIQTGKGDAADETIQPDW